jgi:hypothetical protein
MEKASDGSFARITRKTAEDDDDDEDEKDWGRALNRYYNRVYPGLAKKTCLALKGRGTSECVRVRLGADRFRT